MAGFHLRFTLAFLSVLSILLQVSEVSARSTCRSKGAPGVVQQSTGGNIEQIDGGTTNTTGTGSTGSTGSGGSLASGTELRILPFGDSITQGYGSSDSCGYREQLYSALSSYKVTMVGSITSGSCPHNQHAGYGGQTIQYLSDNLPANLATNPNLILLMIGTNDMNPSSANDDPTAASQRYAALLSSIYQSAPKVAVLAAKIVGSGGDTERQARDDSFNKLIAGVCSQQAAQGKKCKVVDMSGISSTQNGLSSDGTHPDASGYSKMAGIWASAIQGLDASWIQASTVTPVQTSRMKKRGRRSER